MKTTYECKNCKNIHTEIQHPSDEYKRDLELCDKCRERSKREDAIKECEELGHMNTWMPKNQTICLRCGALNP